MEIIATDKMSDVFNQIQKITDKDTLVVFDVDRVLITKDEASLRDEINFAKSFLWKYPLKIFWSAKLFERLIVETKSKLVDTNTLEIIKYLNENNIKTIAITHAPHSDLKYNDDYKTFAEWRYNDLKNLGIEFNSNEDLTLKNGARFFNGILFAHNNSWGFGLFKGDLIGRLFGKLNKGDCLKEFLKTQDLNPSKIIFVDDLLQNILAVEQYCESKGIDLHAFHYTGDYQEIISAEQMYERLTFYGENEVWV